MPATLKDLEQVEEWIRTGTVKRVWFIVPFPIKGRTAPFTRKLFMEAIIKSRVKLIHEDWSECNKDARMLSQAGGIERVIVASFTSGKATMAVEYHDGEDIHKGKKS